MTTTVAVAPQIQALIGQLRAGQAFFNKSSACLREEDSTFAPVEGMYTAAHQVAHVALTVEWFLDGTFGTEGFDMDFEAHDRAAAAFTSLTKARERFDAAIERAVETLASKTPEEMAEKLPEGPVMGGRPRSAMVGGIVDHTAHHRGALTVYSRLRGYTPEMPYA